MHIVFASSECVPYAKTGGLADVVGSLPQWIANLGHKVTVYIPLYRQVQKHISNAEGAIQSLTIPFEYYNRFVTVVDGGDRAMECSITSSIARSCSIANFCTARPAAIIPTMPSDLRLFSARGAGEHEAAGRAGCVPCARLAGVDAAGVPEDDVLLRSRRCGKRAAC